MVVYILLAGYHYERGSILGVFSSLDKAECSRRDITENYDYDYSQVLLMEVK